MRPGNVVGGKYRLIATLGQGGMGAVYDAEHTGTGSRVAVKLIRVTQDLDPESTHRFELEARASASLASQHIVRVFDTGTDELVKCAYLVMDKLVGEDLSALLKRVGRLPADVALRIVA